MCVFSEDALRYLFASVARVSAVRLIRDHSTSRGARTFGFVEFYSIAEATQALNALQVCYDHLKFTTVMDVC
jgi:hypothetical protein